MFASSIMTLDLYDKVVVDTNNQSECKLWNELRCGRSFLDSTKRHIAAYPVVILLIKKVIDSIKMDTKLMRRERNLEKKVIKVLKEKNKLSLDSY